MNKIEEIILKNLNPGQKPDYIGLSKALGVTPNTLRSWRKNTTQPKIDQLLCISSVLGVTIDKIINIDMFYLHNVSYERVLLLDFMKFMYKDKWDKVKFKISKKIDDFMEKKEDNKY